MRSVICLLFDNFETLDLFGPVEIFGRMKEEFKLSFCSCCGGVVTSSHDVMVMSEPVTGQLSGEYVLLVPGGAGVAALVKDPEFVNSLKLLSSGAEYILTVCTGSILLSKTGILNGRNATSNKRLFQWALNESPGVNWIRRARWVRDGNIYTGSGVSAGIDMTLGFIRDVIGYDAAKRQSVEIEYSWNEDPDNDVFAEYC